MSTAPYRESASSSARPLRVVLQEYRWATDARVLWAAIPFVVVMLWELWTLFSPSHTSLRSESPFSTYAIFGLMGMSVMYIAHRSQGNRDDVVRIFDDGVLVARDGSISEMRWEDLATLSSRTWHAGRGKLGQRHVLTSSGGETMTFTHEIVGIEALVDELEKRVVRKALPPALLSYRAGRSVTFGAVSVNKHGIARGTAVTPWSAVGPAVRGDGVLAVHGRDPASPRVTVPLEKLSNVCVLVALIDHARSAT